MPLAASFTPPVVVAQCAANALNVTEPLDRSAPSVVCWEPTRLVVARAHLEVEPQLVVDVGVDVGPPEAEVAAPHRRWPRRLALAHISAGEARNTCVTAPA